MKFSEKIRTMLRRLCIPEDRLMVALDRPGRPLEDLDAEAQADPFDIFYTVAEVSARLSFSEITIRRKIRRGEFGPLVHLVRDGDNIRLPWSAVAYYLRTHSMAVDGAYRDSLVRRLVPVADRHPVEAGTRARSAGEIRRRTANG